MRAEALAAAVKRQDAGGLEGVVPQRRALAAFGEQLATALVASLELDRAEVA
jgi:hypothetical protein